MLLPGFKSEMSAGSTCILFIYQQGATTLVAKKKSVYTNAAPFIYAFNKVFRNSSESINRKVNHSSTSYTKLSIIPTLGKAYWHCLQASGHIHISIINREFTAHMNAFKSSPNSQSSQKGSSSVGDFVGPTIQWITICWLINNNHFHVTTKWWKSQNSF